MTSSFVILENVTLAESCIIEPYCYLGISPSNKMLPVQIGVESRIRAGTYIYEGNIIGHHFQTGNKVNIRENNQIGNYVSIGTESIIEHHIQIEDHVRIHSSVFVPEYTTLKKHAWLGPNCVLTNARYPRSQDVKEQLMGPIIEENVKIGAGAIILPGITIGANSLIGAGSVVTKDIPPDSVAVGNPAKVIKKIDQIVENPYSTR